MADIRFEGFPKMARLQREIIITEKIDGTNACIKITPEGDFLTGSRTRWITPTNDNFGFSRWAHENKHELMELGEGLHFGEWWGSGIQRGYNLPKGEKRFSLFNTSRWKTICSDAEGYETLPACCNVVPELYKGDFDSFAITAVLDKLRHSGSVVSPGFMNAEGIVIFHTAANFCFKRTLDNDGIPKSLIK